MIRLGIEGDVGKLKDNGKRFDYVLQILMKFHMGTWIKGFLLLFFSFKNSFGFCQTAQFRGIAFSSDIKGRTIKLNGSLLCDVLNLRKKKIFCFFNDIESMPYCPCLIPFKNSSKNGVKK